MALTVLNYIYQWVAEELMQGIPYSTDLVHCGSDNPQFEVDLEQSSLMEIRVQDNKRDMIVKLPLKLLLNQTFDLQEWYAQK